MLANLMSGEGPVLYSYMDTIFSLGLHTVGGVKDLGEFLYKDAKHVYKGSTPVI